MIKPPSERELLRVERALKKLRVATQRVVSDGVYMRLDRSGRRRFVAGACGVDKHLGRTYDTWAEDEFGPLEMLTVDSAVKDLAGHLIEGEPKTGAREPTLFAAIAKQLEAIYQLKGGGDLDALTFPNRNGGLLDWGNWRTEVWYPALYRGGISNGPTADARGAFRPYDLRHVGITVMLHAQRPEGGTYSRHEVAKQFGHTVATHEGRRVTLVDLKRLVELWIEHFDRLDDAARQLLPLKPVYLLVPEG